MKFSVVTPLWQDRPAAENLAVAVAADSLGFDELWVGEMATYDVFAFAATAAQRTEKIALTLGPLAVSVRTPMTMAMGVASVADLSGRRVNLALGASSTVVVEEWHGRPRKRTAKHLEETAQITRLLLAGEKVDFEGELASCRGYRLRLDPAPGPLTIAAFGPAAVRVAGRQADRMVLNMVTPASLAALKGQLAESAERAGREAPAMAVWLPCAVNPDEADYQQLRRAIVGYLAAPGYGEMIVEAGFGELVEFARSRPHPKALFAALPNKLLQAVGLVGTEAAIVERVAAYRDAGADEICLVPATAGDGTGLTCLQFMRSMANG